MKTEEAKLTEELIESVDEKDTEEVEENNQQTKEAEKKEELDFVMDPIVRLEVELKNYKGGALKVGEKMLEHLQNDGVAAQKYFDNKLTLMGICKYIVEEVYKSAADFAGKKCSFMNDDDVYSLAIHYVDETKEDKTVVNLPKGTKMKSKTVQTKKPVKDIKRAIKEAKNAAFEQLDFSDILGL